jgi:transposase
VLTAMARSTIKFLKQQGQFNTRIARLVDCDRHTVARVLAEPTEPPRRRRRRLGTLEPQREALLSWIREEIPTTRMLELARQDAQLPYSGGVSTFYRFVAKLRAELEAGAAPVIRFERHRLHVVEGRSHNAYHACQTCRSRSTQCTQRAVMGAASAWAS